MQMQINTLVTVTRSLTEHERFKKLIGQTKELGVNLLTLEGTPVSNMLEDFQEEALNKTGISKVINNFRQRFNQDTLDIGSGILTAAMVASYTKESIESTFDLLNGKVFPFAIGVWEGGQEAMELREKQQEQQQEQEQQNFSSLSDQLSQYEENTKQEEEKVKQEENKDRVLEIASQNIVQSPSPR